MTPPAATVLVTGASGFVGRAVVARMLADGETVRALVHRESTMPAGVARVVVADLERDADWRPSLDGVTAVVHAAARVHQMQETSADPLPAYRAVNTAGTLRFAQQAADAGVKRFVFLSTIKVNGDSTVPGKPFTADDPAAPSDAYARSKFEAEEGLKTIAARTGMDVAIIRPVLVYGPGVKANFLAMMRWVERGVPLPLGAVHNQRSLVAIDNLVDLVVTCVRHPSAANEVFLVSDGEDVSTADLLRRTAKALDRGARLIPIPVSALRAAATMTGRRALADRLLGWLQVDIAKTRRRLGWSPPVTLDEALAKLARGVS